MPKQIYCAKCGTELYFALKALPKANLIITIVEPHKCPKETKANPFKDINNEIIIKPKDKKRSKDLDKMFEGFEFAKSLGGNDSIPTTTIFDKGDGDKRDNDALFDKGALKSSAPSGILSNLKTLGNSTPESDLED